MEQSKLFNDADIANQYREAKQYELNAKLMAEMNDLRTVDLQYRVRQGTTRTVHWYVVVQSGSVHSMIYVDFSSEQQAHHMMHRAERQINRIPGVKVVFEKN